MCVGVKSIKAWSQSQGITQYCLYVKCSTYFQCTNHIHFLPHSHAGWISRLSVLCLHRRDLFPLQPHGYVNQCTDVLVLRRGPCLEPVAHRVRRHSPSDTSTHGHSCWRETITFCDWIHAASEWGWRTEKTYMHLMNTEIFTYRSEMIYDPDSFSQIVNCIGSSQQSLSNTDLLTHHWSVLK